MHRSRRSFQTALLSLLVTAAAVALGHGSPDEARDVMFTAREYAIEGPAFLGAGFTELGVENQGQRPYDLMLLKLEEGIDLDELHGAIGEMLSNPGPEGINGLLEYAEFRGGVSAAPGERGTVTLELEPGRYALTVLSPDEEGRPLSSLGMFHEIEVSADGAEATQLVIDMTDFAFAMPDQIPAGTQTWQITNSGDQIHELVLMRPAPGKSVEDVYAYLQAPQGPPPAVPVAHSSILSPGAATYLTMDLEPGSYVALCFLPDHLNDTGAPHVALGMVADFTVVEEQAQR